MIFKNLRSWCLILCLIFGATSAMAQSTTADYQITTRLNNLYCLDDPSATIGTKIRLWQCLANSSNQIFSFDSATSEIRVNGKCLDGTSLVQRTLLSVNDCNGNASQKWFYRAKTGELKSSNGLCVDLDQGNVANGTSIGLEKCQRNKNQKWNRILLSPSTTTTSTTSTTTTTTSTSTTLPLALSSSVASSLGLTKLAFDDEFNANSIGTKWFLSRPFGYGSLSTQFVSVANGVLTLTGDGVGPNYSIATIQGNGAGGWMGYASNPGAITYFEASIRFDPSYRGGSSNGWPSFWSMSAEHLFGGNSTHWGEVDFMEDLLWNWNAPNDYAATIHDWNNGNHQNSNNAVRTGFNPFTWNGWHTYGCVIRPGRIEMYLDGVLHSEATVSWSPGAQYSIIDQHHFPLILGTGTNSVMQIDWVRVWTK